MLTEGEDQRKVEDLMSRWDSRFKVAFGLLPIPLFYPFWWKLRHAIGLEGAMLLLIVVQGFLVAVVSDRALAFAARAYLRRKSKF